MAGNLNKPATNPFPHVQDMDYSRLQFTVLMETRNVHPALVRELVPGVTTLREACTLSGLPANAQPLPYARLDEPVGNGNLYGDNYVYTHHEGSPDWWTFFFAELRSDEEIATPVPWLSYSTNDVHNWPAVLRRLTFREDLSDTYEVVVDGRPLQIPKLFASMEMIEGGGYATEIRRDVFVSHKQFEPSFFKLDVPVTTTVSWSMRNESGSINCLHPYCEFPQTEQRGTTYPAGTVNEPDAQAGRQIFPATNHTAWIPHVYHESQDQVSGLWVLDRRTCYPPKGFKITKRRG